MGFLFGGSKPSPAPVPQTPMDSAEAERKRAEAEREAIAQQKAAGRRSTNVGGAREALASRQSDSKYSSLG